EFRRVIAELQMGIPRAEALRRMAQRAGVPELTSFVVILIQSERLGASITRVLHAQAEAMRVRRRQRAEEEAHKAPVKMMIPLVLFVFPALFIVIVGPALPRLFAAFGK
ncbi:MAG: type II secretion system F family protein, partial [Chloroflexi bacterium]|nr:type II secretion system F family protein [Chloroflexota bacterium]